MTGNHNFTTTWALVFSDNRSQKRVKYVFFIYLFFLKLQKHSTTYSYKKKTGKSRFLKKEKAVTRFTSIYFPRLSRQLTSVTQFLLIAHEYLNSFRQLSHLFDFVAEVSSFCKRSLHIYCFQNGLKRWPISLPSLLPKTDWFISRVKQFQEACFSTQTRS